jgi:hypothetical protein
MAAGRARRGRRRLALVVAAAVVVVSNVGMAPQHRTMRRTGDVGILRFELMGTRAKAEEILARLGAEGQAAARRSLSWDFLFVAGYALGGAVLAGALSERARRRGRPGWARAAELAGHGVVVAAVLDVGENLALLGLLDQRDGGVDLALVATVCAAVKWTIVIAAGAVAVCVAVLRRVQDGS